MQIGDTVKLKASVDPEMDYTYGIIEKVSEYRAYVRWNVLKSNSTHSIGETHYLANLEPYKRPFAVGDKVDIDSGFRTGTIAYIGRHNNKTQYIIDTGSDHGLFLRHEKSLKHK